MTQDEIRSYYGTFSSTAKSHNYTIGRLLLNWKWGEDCWDSITAKDECYTDYFRISRIRNLTGLKCWQLICWRLIVTWAIVP